MIKYKPSEILQYFLWADPPFLNIGLLDSVYVHCPASLSKAIAIKPCKIPVISTYSLVQFHRKLLFIFL